MAMREVLEDELTKKGFEIDKEMSWWAATGYASVGEVEQALHWLSVTIELGFLNHRFFSEHDPHLSQLVGNPRFEALRERAREKQREIEAVG